MITHIMEGSKYDGQIPAKGAYLWLRYDRLRHRGAGAGDCSPRSLRQRWQASDTREWSNKIPLPPDFSPHVALEVLGNQHG
jgi:hypothetical protein